MSIRSSDALPVPGLGLRSERLDSVPKPPAPDADDPERLDEPPEELPLVDPPLEPEPPEPEYWPDPEERSELERAPDEPLVSVLELPLPELEVLEPDPPVVCAVKANGRAAAARRRTE